MIIFFLLKFLLWSLPPAWVTFTASPGVREGGGEGCGGEANKIYIAWTLDPGPEPRSTR